MNPNETTKFNVGKDQKNVAREIMDAVYSALLEKGYNPIDQLVGYFISGDPSYITGHANARGLIRRMERDELLEEIVKEYLNK